ncbi:MAG: hypothetical protein WC584_04940 [Candidatus Pacearchaeota archaeon]
MTNLEKSFDVFRYTTVPREEVRNIFGAKIRSQLKEISFYRATRLTDAAHLPKDFFQNVCRGNYEQVTGENVDTLESPFDLSSLRTSFFKKDFSGEEREEILAEMKRRNFVNLGSKIDDASIYMFLPISLYEQL